MRQPSVLSRRNPYLNKKDFGHVLVVAGSPTMLGACALCSLAAMRSGAGLVTAAVPKSLNLTLQKKISHVVMTLPLPETPKAAISTGAFEIIKKSFKKYDAVAMGPGLGLDPSTKRFIYKMVEQYPGPMVVDADALNLLAINLKVLDKAKGPRILTPHAGEMSRLIGRIIGKSQSERKKIALDFTRQHRCILVLKGHRTVIASEKGEVAVNTSGNVGMATAGSGDVLTGMIASFLAQGMKPFIATQMAVELHGLAGDLIAQNKKKRSIIATDLIEEISYV